MSLRGFSRGNLDDGKARLPRFARNDKPRNLNEFLEALCFTPTVLKDLRSQLYL